MLCKYFLIGKKFLINAFLTVLFPNRLTFALKAGLSFPAHCFLEQSILALLKAEVFYGDNYVMIAIYRIKKFVRKSQ